MKNKKSVKFLILISIFVGISYLISNLKLEPVEKLGISSGIGYDLEEKTNGNFIYSIPISAYIPNENKRGSQVYTGKGKSIGETRDDRQKKFNQKLLIGFEKVYIVSENYAEEGLKNSLDILFNNPKTNEIGLFCVCKGNSEDYFKKSLQGYDSSADFIEGLLRSAYDSNFFSDDYKVLDIYVRVGSEGRCAVLPYIELNKDAIEITGVAVFKKDKMMHKLDMENTRLLNILKENNTKGTITLRSGIKHYTDFKMKSNRKVTCYREGDKYKFIINILLRGDIISNELEMYDKKINDPEAQEYLKEAVSEDMKVKLNGFIEKMKNEYKMDCLDLGRVAAAKYGRGKNINWDNIICNSEIKVNVETKIDLTGRGDY